MKRIYRCDIDTDWTSYEVLKNRHVVAQGWSGSGDVSFFAEERDLTAFVELMLHEHQGVWTDSLSKVNTVFNRLAYSQPGDIFIATEGQRIKGICELPARFTYAFMPDDEYANSLYPVQWVDWKDFCNDVSSLCRSPGPMRRISSPVELTRHVEEDWDEFKKRKGINIQPIECEEKLAKLMAERPQKIKESRDRYINSLRKKGIEIMNDKYASLLLATKNIVFTGAPGTGKTYLARQIARTMVLSDTEKQLPEAEAEKLVEDRTKFVQFHPSYDYTDFVEGLRPIQGADGQVGFRRQDGAFKKLCKAAIAAGLAGGVDNFDKAWDELLVMLEKDERLSVPLKSKTGEFPISLNEYGTGLASRTYDESGADWIRGQSKFFTKEQLYNVYLGNPGVPSGGHDNYRKAIVDFMREHCHLKDYQKGNDVVGVKLQPYVMIIDEINRGDISKIFGELFYAIDDGYRGPKGRVDTQYQNLVEEGDVFAGGFYVPENVYIIGTMNDVDRNVESMDFAIRRRFTWEEIEPGGRFDAMMTGLKDSNDVEIPTEIITLAKDRMNGLNAEIRIMKNGLGPAYQIGPAYFAKIKDYAGDAEAKFKALWDRHLRPLLCEYLRGMERVEEAMAKLKDAYDLKKPQSTNGESEDNA